MTQPADQARGLLQHRHAAPTAPWVAVTGAKGGVGKTLIAVNLATLVARAGYRTLLVDLDPGLGNVDVHLRLSPPFSVEDVALGACPAVDAVIDGPGGIRVLGGRNGSTRLASGDTDFLRRVLQAVEDAAVGCDVVICDTGAGIGPAVLGTAERAQVVLGVTAPEPAALTDSYALCKLLHLRGRPLPGLVINRVRSRDEALRTAGKLTEVCRRFLHSEPRLIGWLQRDPGLEKSVAEQRAFALHGTGPALEDLEALAAAALAALPPLARRRTVPPTSRAVRLRPQLR